MSKKKIVAVILFIFVGLFIFVFANPRDKEENLKPVTPNQEEQEEIDNSDNDTEEEQDDIDNQNNLLPVFQETWVDPIINLEPEKVVILKGYNYDVTEGITFEQGDLSQVLISINDTKSLNGGIHEIIYTAKNTNKLLAKRTLIVLEPANDDDLDGFTNKEEFEGKTDYNDPNSYPETNNPTITLEGDLETIVSVKTEYIEAGYKITLDSHDTITKLSDVVITGTVNTNIVSEYTLTYTITDRYGKSASISRTIKVVDIEKPVITLNGDATVTLEVFDTYNELGAIVSDNYDPDLVVSISGEIDINTIGTYEIKYNVKDSSDNEAVEKIRIVEVVDTEKPVITLNGESAIYLLQGETYTEQGASISDNYDANLIISISGEVDINTIGTYEIKYNVKDSSNNEAIEKVRTIYVLDPNGDFDNDGFTNQEERDNNTKLEDETSYPTLGTPNFDSFINEITINQFEDYQDVLPTAKDTLNKEVNVQSSGEVNVNVLGNYTITYTATDRKGNEATATRTVKVVDNEDPIITLKGSSSLTLRREYKIPLKFWEAGYVLNYVEAGYDITEANDYDITKTITFKKPYSNDETAVDSINPEIGEYTITYKVVDSSDNEGLAVRTVYVIRAIDEVKDIEINVGKTEFNVCTASICNELTVNDYQATAKDWFNGKGFDYTYINNITMENNVDITKVGTYSVKFIATDWRGQQMTLVKNIKVVDKVAPTISLSPTETISVRVKGVDINIPKPIVSDNYDNISDLSISYTFKGEYKFNLNILVWKSTTDIYLNTIIYKVKDKSGNTATYTYNYENRYFLKNVSGIESILNIWEE